MLEYLQSERTSYDCGARVTCKNEVRNSLCKTQKRQQKSLIAPKKLREETDVKNKKCTKELSEKMYGFFKNYSGDGAPSFSKFARESRLTVERLESFRKNGEFDRIYRECKEIRKDIIIDKALTKRADASFAKFLLSDEEDGKGEGGIDLTITVIE